METIERAGDILLWVGVVFLGITILFCLLRCVLGPRFTDRVISVNIIGTKTIIMLAALALLLEQGGLVDIAVVYAMISFLAVVVLSKCYLLPHHKNPADYGAGRDEGKEAD